MQLRLAVFLLVAVCLLPSTRAGGGGCTIDQYEDSMSQCQPKKALDEPCDAPEECVDAACTDSICACILLLPYYRDGMTCVASCPSTKYPDGSDYVCKDKKALDDSCAIDDECLSDDCTDLTCGCPKNRDGMTCVESCPSTKYSNSDMVCTDKKALGESCSEAYECLSDDCTDLTCDCPEYRDDTTCVQSCPSTKYPNSDDVCTDKKALDESCDSADQCESTVCSVTCVCPAESFIDDMTCVESCPAPKYADDQNVCKDNMARHCGSGPLLTVVLGLVVACLSRLG